MWICLNKITSLYVVSYGYFSYEYISRFSLPRSVSCCYGLVLNVPQGPAVDAEGLVFLGDDGKLCNITFGTWPWRRCCDPDTSSPVVFAFLPPWAEQLPLPKPLFSTLAWSSASSQSHRHLCTVTMEHSLWNWARLHLSLKVIPPPTHVFVKVTDYWLIYRQHGVIISPYNLITFIVSIIPV